MRKSKFICRNLTVICALVGMALVPGKKFVAASPRAGSAGADIRSELRALDAYVVELGRFDKRCAELGKKVVVAQIDFDSQQRIADDLRRRVSGVQGSLQAIVRKLKESGELDNLDQFILSKITDGTSNTFLRREGFKKILETAALQLSNDANQVSSPLDAIRAKVRAHARDSIFETNKSPLSLLAVRASYDPSPAVFDLNLRCRIGWLRVGFSKAFTGDVSQGAQDTVNCHCFGNQSACNSAS